jgi:predicted 2-oxoglutarate/Fe(II)-dependent dioxygenase YbiX
MSKRLQVLLDEPELREIRRAARAKRLTVAEWVRGALREARRKEPLGNVADKIAVIRRAARHSFPSGDIDQMLAEIEKGYLAGGPEEP